MRLLVGFAAILVLVCACTSNGSDDPTSASTPTTVTSKTPTAAPSSEPTTAPPTPKSAPATPTVPADVPTTGPNTKPGETPPVLPVVGTTRTRAGAKAFAEFFMKAVDWGYATTDGAYIAHYSTPACAGCTSLVQTMNSDKAKGYRYIGGRTVIRDSKPGAAGALRSQNVVVDTTSFQRVDRNGKGIDGDQAHDKTTYRLQLVWTSAGFKTHGLAVSL